MKTISDQLAYALTRAHTRTLQVQEWLTNGGLIHKKTRRWLESRELVKVGRKLVTLTPRGGKVLAAAKLVDFWVRVPT